MQSLWIDMTGEGLGLFEVLSIKSFLRFGYKFHLYVYDMKMKNVPEGVELKDANDIIPESEIFEYEGGGISAFSNMFRYKLLYDKGGIWVDMDLVCLKPLELEEEYIFSSENIMTNVGFIKVPAQMKFMNFCYNHILTIKKSPKKIAWGDLGPKLFAKFIKNAKLMNYVKEPYVFCPVGHDNYNDLLTFNNPNDSTCVHLWNHCWEKDESNKLNLLRNRIFKDIFFKPI